MKKRLKWYVTQYLDLPQTSDKIQKNSFIITETINDLETVSLVNVLKGELKIHYQVNIYLSKVKNKNTGKKCEICSKLTIKTLEERHWRVFIVHTTLNILHTIF